MYTLRREFSYRTNEFALTSLRAFKLGEDMRGRKLQSSTEVPLIF